ncbi:hypothetical protein LXA43DRAFT_1103923 [Ganoderma leucocontextum]|nr:hypothetical protein LXA43DRAFT_1103923 [Ganoderma leucocontextum]
MQLNTSVARGGAYFDRGCQNPSCKNALSNVLCVGMNLHMKATFRHCECTRLEEVLGALNLVLVSAEPPVGIAADILSFYTATKALSTGPITPLGDIIEAVCRGNDVHFDSSILADDFAKLIARFEVQSTAKSPPPINAPKTASSFSGSQPQGGHDIPRRHNPAVDSDAELLSSLSQCTINRHYDVPDDSTIDQLADVMSSLSFVHRTVYERPNSDRIVQNRIVFTGEDLDGLRKPDALFTTSLMRACVWLLRDTLSNVTPSKKCALFSPDVWASFLICGYLNDPEQISRLTERQDYWTKSTWIFPICQDSHWCLGVVNLQSRSLHIFDSLSRKANLDVMCPDLLQLTVYLATAAQQLGQTNLDLSLDGWNAYPSVARSLQTNGYDCGPIRKNPKFYWAIFTNNSSY